VDLDAIAARIKEACSTSDKPVVMVVETISKWYGLMHSLREGGVPVYEFPEDGARSLAAMARYSEYRDRKSEPPPELSVDRTAAAAIIERYQGKDAFLPQLDACELLAAYGVPVPKTARVTGAADLPAAAKAVGFPCVLKVDSPDVIHKSDEGGVILDLGDEKALASAFTGMNKKFSGRSATYLLMEQKAAGREIIIGAKASPGLGSLVMFGLGGIFVEVMKDVVVAVAPLSRPEAREMLNGIKGYPILEGVRGEPGVDLSAIEDLLLRVSRLAADFASITEMDLNPIFTYPDGTAPVAVDVRIRVC
jgi:acetyltransferase